jgi:putative membrane protein
MDRRNALSLIALSLVVPSMAVAAAADNAEMDHAARTLAAGAVSLESSKIAQTKAQDAWVKKFADYEVAEQTTVAEVLTTMGATPAKPDKMASIDKLKNSANFDADYIAAQLDGHAELLKIQESYIAKGKDRAHIGMAKLARGQIKEHIDLLQTIKKNLKT